MIKHLTDSNFEEATASGVILLDFAAEWCGPCRTLSPLLDEVAPEYEGKADIGKINVDECPELSVKFGIRSIPVLLLMKDGKEVSRKVGMQPKPIIKSLIESAL